VTSPEQQKRLAAEEAVAYVVGQPVVGIGSGTTVDVFVDVLAASGVAPIGAAVPASEATAARLRAAGIAVLTLADAGGALPVYVDGCDEADPQLRLVKGAGGAFVREKVLASAAEQFVCIADERKDVRRLGERMPVPVEVVPMALPFVDAQLRRLGGTPVERAGYVSDNGNAVLDVTGLPLDYPETLERSLAAIPGVVGSGVFALRPADVLLLGTAEGAVRTLVRTR
jgi:ribose 5-phosphate isomerase A